MACFWWGTTWDGFSPSSSSRVFARMSAFLWFPKTVAPCSLSGMSLLFFTPFSFLTMSHTFLVGVSAVSELQKLRQASLLVFLISLLALAVHRLSSIVFAIVGFLSALLLALLLTVS